MTIGLDADALSSVLLVSGPMLLTPSTACDRSPSRRRRYMRQRRQCLLWRYVLQYQMARAQAYAGQRLVTARGETDVDDARTHEMILVHIIR